MTYGYTAGYTMGFVIAGVIVCACGGSVWGPSGADGNVYKTTDRDWHARGNPGRWRGRDGDAVVDGEPAAGLRRIRTVGT